MSGIALDHAEPTPTELAEDLYRFLCALDPATWRAEAVASAREALERLRARAYAMLESWREAPARTLPEVHFQNAVERMVGALPEPSQLGDARAEWIALRERLAPLHESMARALRAEGEHVPLLRPTNYVRNLFHVGNAVFVVALFELFLDATTAIWVAGAAAAMAWSFEISRRLSERVNDFMMWVFGPVAHAHEARGINSATWFTTALLGLALTLYAVADPTAERAAMLGLLALGFGDPMAALVGRRWGSIRLWRNRSLEGTATFAVVASAVGLLYLGLLHPAMGWGPAAAVACAAGVVGALVELVSVRIDDNLTIPLVTAWVALATQALVL